MIVKPGNSKGRFRCRFESSVNSYDSQTSILSDTAFAEFESSVNSYDSQTVN